MLFYYAVTNASALTLAAEERRWTRALPVGGIIGCIVLGLSLPAARVVGGTALLGVGSVVWLASTRRPAARAQ